MLNYFNKNNEERINSISSLNSFAREVHQRDSFDIIPLMTKMKDLIDNKFINSLINFELNKMSEDNDYFPLSASSQSLNLLDCQTSKLDLKHLSQITYNDYTKFRSFPNDMALIPVGNDNIEIELYEQEDSNSFLFSKKEVSLSSKEPIFIKFGKDVIKFKETNKIENIYILILVSKMEPPYLPRYNFEGKLQKLPFRNLQSFRLESMCELLGKNYSERSFEILENLSKSKDFHIRWNATVNIISISKELGLKKMEKLLNDQHPHVRQAAENYLKNHLK